MKKENLILVIALLILSPIAIFFLIGMIGGLLGNDDGTVILIGIAILCDVVIGCTAILLGTLHRLIRMIESKG